MNAHPKFAIIRLRANDDVFGLFRLLIQHGYPEVSFVNGLREESFAMATAECSAVTSAKIENKIENGDEQRVEGGRGEKGVRQRGSRARNEDPSVYAHCRLCQNKIMASRLSNLTNHVRRHASLKQFQCCYCHYTHNEMAKVRLHMLHNHKDKDSQPIDNLSPEMQAQWDYLMEQCFPQYNKDCFTKDLSPSAASIGISQVNVATVTPSLNDLQRQYVKSMGREEYTCIECGEVREAAQLETHLRQCHLADCVPYVCTECGYVNREQWKVRLHISVTHPHKAAEVSVTTASTDPKTFLSKFFPDYHNKHLDDDDQLLIESIRKEAAGLLSNASKMNQNEEKFENAADVRDTTAKRVIQKRRKKRFSCTSCPFASLHYGQVRLHRILRHNHPNTK